MFLNEQNLGHNRRNLDSWIGQRISEMNHFLLGMLSMNKMIKDALKGRLDRLMVGKFLVARI